MCYSDFEFNLYVLTDEIAYNDYETIGDIDVLDNFVNDLTEAFEFENDNTELVLEDEQKANLYHYYKTRIEHLRKIDEYLTQAVNEQFEEEYGDNTPYIKWGILKDCFNDNFDDYEFIYKIFECALGLKIDDETEEEIRKVYRTLYNEARNYK